jgi:cation:H+ antiporter
VKLMTNLLVAVGRLSLPLVALAFFASLAVALGASAWFTRRLETVCAALRLSPGILSVLGALGANIPNYVAAIDALASGRGDVGLGIIIGSNIYNIAIILGISTFATPGGRGITLSIKETRDVHTVALYTLAILLLTLFVVWFIPGSPLIQVSHDVNFTHFMLIGVCLLVLGVFGALVFHIVRRPHLGYSDELATASGIEMQELVRDRTEQGRLLLVIGEAVLALAIALGGVIIMVQAGQGLTVDLNIPSVLAGLLVLAVATSLPNTVVAVSLARANMHAANAEEVFSSNAVNAAFGIALPLLIWPVALHDRLLPFLDAPFMVALTLAALICVYTGRVSRRAGLLLLLMYAVWVAAHMLL